MAKRQIVGGNWQDPLGSPLALGYITFQINKDATTGSVQVNAGQIVSNPLDSSGNVNGTFNIWPNDQLTPVTVYKIKAYTAKGLLVWESENTIPSGGGTFDLGILTPLVY